MRGESIEEEQDKEEDDGQGGRFGKENFSFIQCHINLSKTLSEIGLCDCHIIKNKKNMPSTSLKRLNHDYLSMIVAKFPHMMFYGNRY